MQPDGGRWRITAVQDDKLAQQIAEGVKKTCRRPALVYRKRFQTVDKVKIK